MEDSVKVTKLTSKTTTVILCSFFAALTAVCSGISIPLPGTPVPINLATLSVFLAGGLLGSKWGSLSQIVYVLLGAIGLPVFHGFTGGFGILIGPTGGYIAGYVLAAFIVGYLMEKINTANKNSYVKIVVSMIAGLLACYILGTIWFMFITKTPLLAALMTCVIPFLLGDAIKILLGSMLVNRLKKHLI